MTAKHADDFVSDMITNGPCFDINEYQSYLEHALLTCDKEEEDRLTWDLGNVRIIRGYIRKLFVRYELDSIFMSEIEDSYNNSGSNSE